MEVLIQEYRTGRLEDFLLKNFSQNLISAMAYNKSNEKKSMNLPLKKPCLVDIVTSWDQPLSL